MCSDKPTGGERWEDKVWKKHQYNDRTVLKSGSYLNTYCPYCDQSLMRDQMIHLDAINPDGSEGWVELSPYLNVFDRKSDIRLDEKQEVTDLLCPECGRSLCVPGRTCAKGDAQVACIMIGISSIRVPMYFCMRMGCSWHLIDPNDEHKIILDESLEW